jgi:hypothetical protein
MPGWTISAMYFPRLQILPFELNAPATGAWQKLPIPYDGRRTHANRGCERNHSRAGMRTPCSSRNNLSALLRSDARL